MKYLQDLKYTTYIIEAAYRRIMQTVFAMYCNLVSIYIHFGYSFRTASKDFIK